MSELLLVSAAALIDARQRILIARRPQTRSYPGKWELPGGKIEPGETPEAALARELREELAITVVPADMEAFTFISYRYPEFAVLIPIFICQRWTGTVRAVENQALAWCSEEQATSYDFLPSNAGVMKRLAHHLRDQASLHSRDMKNTSPVSTPGSRRG